MNTVNPFTVTTTSFGTVSCCRRDMDGTVSYEIHAMLNFGVAQRNPKFFGEYIVRGQHKVAATSENMYPSEAVCTCDATYPSFDAMWEAYKEVQGLYLAVAAIEYKAKQAAERKTNELEPV